MRKVFATLLLMGIGAITAGYGVAADDFKPEPGFTPLFNGKDLTGWKMKKGGESLDGKTEAAGKRFTVVDGTLVVDPKVKGDIIIETAKSFGKDVHIKFEFKPGEGCNNDLFFRGHKFDLKKGDPKNSKSGEWNEFEVIVAGDKTEFKCNKELVKTGKTTSESSAFGLRAEFGAIEYRRLRIKEGK